MKLRLILGVTKLSLTCPWFIRASSKPQQICFEITRIFINTSVLRKTNGSNFEAKLFPSVPDIVNGHVVYWKAMRLGSVHFYDCFSPVTVFDLKRVRMKILNQWKHTKKEKKNHTNTFLKKILSGIPFYCVLTNQNLAWSQSLWGTSEGRSVPSP